MACLFLIFVFFQELFVSGRAWRNYKRGNRSRIIFVAIIYAYIRGRQKISIWWKSIQQKIAIQWKMSIP